MATYEPNLDLIWNRRYPMDSPPTPFKLYYVERQFKLGPEWSRCSERPVLHFSLERGQIELTFGPRCSVPSAVLAPLTELTRVHVVLGRYRAHGDTDIGSSWGSSIRITFRAGRKFMKFLRSDWGTDTWYNEPEFLQSLEELAEAAGAEYRLRKVRRQLSYDD